MNRLNVQAAIHPTSIARVLVYVEREDGSSVELGASDFGVDFWASNQSAPGDPPRYWPAVLSATGTTWGGYELALDDLRYNEDDPTDTWHEPLPSNLENVVYVISVHTSQPDAQGRCIVKQPDI